MTNCNYEVSVILLEAKIKDENRSQHTYEAVSPTRLMWRSCDHKSLKVCAGGKSNNYGQIETIPIRKSSKHLGKDKLGNEKHGQNERLQVPAQINLPDNIRGGKKFPTKVFAQCALYLILYEEMNLSLPLIQKNKHKVMNANILQ